MKTRREFVMKATRAAEKSLWIPAGWWGTYRDVRGPNGERVRFSGTAYILSLNGEVISKHDSRASAISKARRIYKGRKGRKGCR